MANFLPQKQQFCMSYRRAEVPKIIPLEYKLMEETGLSRAEVHKQAVKYWVNHRQQSKLQMG